MQKTFLFTYLVRSQRLNVHLLGLSLQRFFVGPHRLHDGAVVEEDQDHWQEVVKEDNKENVAPVVQILAHVVVAAGQEHTLRGVPSPNTC